MVQPAGFASKVAEVTTLFWVMKICATTLGETAGDLLSMTLGIGYALSSLLLLAGFGIALALQLRADRYRPLLYWTVIAATSTAGTTLSDYVDRSLGLGYAAGAVMLGGILAAVLLAWRLATGSLSVTAIREPRTEMFYWAAILASNTLGTALGDYLADSSGLGYAGGAALIAGLLALITLAYFRSSVSRVLLFWLAFVLTRPFGATLGDLLTKSADHGGLGFGTIGASVVLVSILGGLVVRAEIRQRA